MKILFANFQLGQGSSYRKMFGYSGKSYGLPSHYSPTYGAQVVEIDCTPKEYLAILKDIERAWPMSLRRWAPIPQMPEAEPGVQLVTLPDATAERLRQRYPGATAQDLVNAAIAAALTERPEPSAEWVPPAPTEGYVAISDSPNAVKPKAGGIRVNYRMGREKLETIASAERIDISTCENIQAVVDAINRARGFGELAPA